ncbi:tRNA pseudouridine synthase-like 1 isoform X2 [Paramacrobiotus metropolitanus]|uniref:tRNA pseudouridine synthase-like 1 isoform X2 n=1 Tax=Paramacrobiotus metropolitanus TaxID=2943436 RepID=UPI002445AC2F|nr:tRNA pseudouridine synthase-like 1 isoform X2 [Paramacrobiotus metropolitanus]
MVRYLFFFSYFGTRYSGMQSQSARGMFNPRTVTIADVFERALKILKPKNIPLLYVSSRTDTGVHALRSAAAADLHHENPGQYYPAETLVYALNHYFSEHGQDIRVTSAQIVPETFNVRHARRRTYLYRLAVKYDIPNSKLLPFVPRGAVAATLVPLVESKTTWFLGPPFDHRAMVSAARLFLGLHDFRTFSKPPRIGDIPRNPVRFMEICDVSPGKGFLAEHDRHQDGIEYWDITFRSSGFLQRQIRRMIGALVGVAKGRIQEKDIQEMLNTPDPYGYHKALTQAPSEGLFLKDVEFDDKNLTLPPDYFDVIVKHKKSYTFKSAIEYERLFRLLDRRLDQLLA